MKNAPSGDAVHLPYPEKEAAVPAEFPDGKSNDPVDVGVMSGEDSRFRTGQEPQFRFRPCAFQRPQALGSEDKIADAGDADSQLFFFIHLWIRS